jgi:hypothetical protein
MADGQVVFEITGDSKGINSEIKKVTSDIQKESKKWDKATGDATKGIEDSFSKMAGSIVGSLTAAGIGAILMNWGKAAVEAASDLSEVQNVVDTVFGEGANQIDNWAKKAGQQFGLTETQAKKFTSTLGAMMKSSGLAGNEIVNMSTDLAGLAADMASFYNLDFETAFEKIRSGISGETMPLKQLGINMSVANLEAFALAQGLEKTFSQMDQGEQTMLRYQYIMQATADAQGDFAKTADGFANAQRRIETAVETIKTTAGTFLLNTIEPLVAGVASFLEKLTTPVERTVLDDFNDIDIDTTKKMADLEETAAKAQAIIDLLKELEKETVTLKNGGTITLGELFENLGDIEKNGGDVRGYLEGLGVDVEYVIQKYNVWKESTRQLTSLVPSLTAAIDSETGAINGGTDALQRNLDEWKAAEEKKLAWAAYYAKARALEEKKAELWLYDYEASIARKRAEKARDALKNVWGAAFDEQGNISADTLWGNTALTMGADFDKWSADVQHYNLLLGEQKNAEKELTRQTEALGQAEEDLAMYNEDLTDRYGELEQAEEDAADAAEEWGEETKKAGKEAVTAAESALKALADYVQGVKDSTAQAVNSIVKGFEKVNRAGEESRKKSNELATQEADTLNKYTSVWAKWGSDNASLKKMAASWDSLSKEEQNAYEELVKIRNAQKEVNDALGQYSPEGMKNGLQSQIDYMTEYLDNLKKAQEMGLSNELLASLSDGSTESAEYLAGLVEAGPEAAQAVDELYQEVQAQKKTFTDALAEQKLAADETYDALVQKALQTVEDLNLGDEAESAMSDTVGGIAQGIADKVPEVQAAVDAIEEQLNRLAAWGFSFNFGDGGFSLTLDGEHETGLDYVPFDGYLAGLHEGEGILTAEENRIWQRFKNGQSSTGNVDYDALGGVMRENVKAGGNVYLDGRTVGQVISMEQARSYRSLKRSGWQG